MAETCTSSPGAKVRVERGTPAAEAVRGVLAGQCEIIGSLLPLVQRPADPWDPEVLHDLRVAVRRSRSVTGQLRPVFPRGEWRRHREFLRWLQQVTGPARDLDVLAARWDELTAGPAAEPGDASETGLGHREGEPGEGERAGHREGESGEGERAGHREGTAALADRLAARRAAALADLPGVLDTPSVEAGLADWTGFVTAAAGGTDHDNRRQWHRRPAAQLPIEQLVAPRLHHLAVAVTDPDRTRPDVSDDDLHELRKQGKELRYLLEMFGHSVLADEDVARGRKAARALQTELGRHQDGVVHRDLVLSLAGVTSLPSEAADGLPAAARTVVGRLDDDRAEARRRVPDRQGAVAVWHQTLPG